LPNLKFSFFLKKISLKVLNLLNRWIKMPEVAYAHVNVDPVYFGIFYSGRESPYKIIAKLTRARDDTTFLSRTFLNRCPQNATSILVQGHQNDINLLNYPGSHSVETLILYLFYESKKRKVVIQKEMPPVEGLTLLGVLTSSKINPWEYLRISDEKEYKRHLSLRLRKSQKGFYFNPELVLQEDEHNPSFYAEIFDGVHRYASDKVELL